MPRLFFRPGTESTSMSRSLFAVTVSLLLLAPAGARAYAPIVTPVRIERVKPAQEKIPTLRFFKENLDFLRSSLDGLNQIPLSEDGHTQTMDENLLKYREMMEAVAAARDTLDGDLALREREALLASVAELAALEAELDLLEGILDDQEMRLGVLENDFLDRRTTAVVVVLRGSENFSTGPLEITDGFNEITRVGVNDTQGQSVREGGVLQVYHELVEPREQTWTLSRTLADGTAAHSYLSFEPVRHRVNFLEIDLDPARADAELEARAWCPPDVPDPAEGGGRR